MPLHILAVDDEKFIRRLIEVNLLRAGFRVSTAEDGEEALERVRADPPDLIVLDVMMPRVDGLEALRRLKADPATAGIPVVMLTARAQDADLFRGYQFGADIYLTKPFNPVELLTFVNRILSPAARAESPVRQYQL
jgi:two-component system alkaline phosphatase synthesis response regulator PhoP/two-component system response regulator VicR